MLGRLRQEAGLGYREFKDSLNNRARLCGKPEKGWKPDLLVFTCDPSIWEAEAAASQVKVSLSYIIKGNGKGAGV